MDKPLRGIKIEEKHTQTLRENAFLKKRVRGQRHLTGFTDEGRPLHEDNS